MKQSFGESVWTFKIKLLADSSKGPLEVSGDEFEESSCHCCGFFLIYFLKDGELDCPG